MPPIWGMYTYRPLAWFTRVKKAIYTYIKPLNSKYTLFIYIFHIYMNINMRIYFYIYANACFVAHQCFRLLRRDTLDLVKQNNLGLSYKDLAGALVFTKSIICTVLFGWTLICIMNCMKTLCFCLQKACFSVQKYSVMYATLSDAYKQCLNYAMFYQ